jgi:serine/threonine-protein kinase
MSEVYLAYDPKVKREVAIKVLPSHLMEDPSFRDRLEREVQTVARLEHPCIVPVYDYGEEVGQPYVVMRYMPGGSLASRITQGPLTPAELSQVIGPLARALDKAHRKNVIHRDIKPGNILFDGEGEAYLADFGIAKAIQSSATMTGSAIIGTPAYMSPEQGSGARNLDGRSDIYSLGVVVFEALTGQQPYQADTPVALVMQHITQEIPSICATRPDLPADCEIVIRRAMAKIPDERYAKAGELATDLARITRGERVLPRPEVHTEATEKLQTPEEEIPKPDLKAGDDLDQRLEKLYTDGLSAFYLEDWERACRSFQAIVAMRPDYKNVAAKLADAERQTKLRALYAQAQAAQEAEDWARARTALEEVVAGEPGFKDAAAMLGVVKKRHQLADLYAEARQLYQGHQWQAVINVFKRIEGLDETYPDLEGLLASARRELDDIERERKLAALYGRGLLHMDAGEWSAALKQFKEIQRLQPGYRDSQALLARAQQELARPKPKRLELNHTEPKVLAGIKLKRIIQVLTQPIILGILALLAGLVALGLAVGVPFRPLTSVLDSRLAFVSNRDGNPEIYIMDEKGAVTRLTRHVASDDSPSWSPDKTRIAFATNRDGNWEIYRINDDGTDVTQVTHHPASDTEPAWSPDGDYIAFTSNRDGKREVYIVGPDGTTRITHTPDPAESWEPAWGPNGIILFTSDRDGKREIYRTAKAGGVERVTNTPGRSESWSPTWAWGRNYMSFVSDRDGWQEIYMLLQEGASQRVTFTPSSLGSWEPTCSVSGQFIVFTSDRSGKSDIYTITEDGLLPVTQTPGDGRSWSPAW